MEGFHLPFLKGYLTTAGLIMAIGAQNAFVLKQGLMKNQVFITALFCTFVDACLISLGVGGLGKVFSSSEVLFLIAKWGGVLFLIWYGARAFRSIFRAQSLEVAEGPMRPSLKETILTLLAVSFLNPHVYLDTMVLIGSIGAQFEAHHRPFFAYGAILASSMWFFGISYGARLLSPLFENPKSWKVLDFITGCIMWGVAISLLFSSYSGE